MEKKSKQQRIKEVIDCLEVGQSTLRIDIVKDIWKDDNYFIRRSFDVLLLRARRELIPKAFKMHKGTITRTH